MRRLDRGGGALAILLVIGATGCELIATVDRAQIEGSGGDGGGGAGGAGGAQGSALRRRIASRRSRRA